MYAQIKKPKENKSRVVANSAGQRKNKRKQSLGFVDNRHLSNAQQILQQVNTPNVVQLSWKIYNSARRHYNDGWGDLYNIIRDQDIKDDINDSGTSAIGRQSLSLGTYYHRGEGKRRWCSIGYENYGKNRHGDEDTDVFHCGPSS
jgi:hypothetical protein